MKPSLDLKPGDIISRYGLRFRIERVLLSWHPIIGPCVLTKQSRGDGVEDSLRVAINYHPFASVKLA